MSYKMNRPKKPWRLTRQRDDWTPPGEFQFATEEMLRAAVEKLRKAALRGTIQTQALIIYRYDPEISYWRLVETVRYADLVAEPVGV